MPKLRRQSTVAAISATFVFAVIAVVGTIALQTAFPVVPPLVERVDEHRRPAPAPAPGLLLDEKGGFAVALNKWFDDRVGFRDLLIRAKNQVDYSLFGTSRRVYIGTEGWLYEHVTTDTELRFDRLPQADLRRYQEAFAAVADRLAARGIRFVLVGFPGKATLYPEHLPSRLQRLATGRNYGELRQYFTRHPNILFVDGQSALERAKAESPDRVYYQTDLHVNINGTIAVVKAIVARIAEAEGRPDIRWNEALDLSTTDWKQGDEARFLSLLRQTSERIPYARAGFAVGQPEQGGQWIIGDRRPANQLKPGEVPQFMFEFRSSPDACATRLPGMLLFGNSFSDNFWTVGLHRYFCFTRRAYQFTDRLPAVVESASEGTKYVIYQIYFPYLDKSTPVSR